MSNYNQVDKPTAEWAFPFLTFDFGMWLNACCCGPCAFSSLRSEFDGSSWCFNCMCVPGCVVRNIMREAYDIEGSCGGDILSGLCACCNYTQLKKELQQPNRARAAMASVIGRDQWKAPLCNTSGTGCLMATFCPVIAAAQARSAYDGSNCFFNFLLVNPVLARNIIREGYGIEGGCMGDIMIAACLPCCNACQLLEEVNVRGEKRPDGGIQANMLPTQQPGSKMV
eukprot:PhM_4_TR609/c1_g1_i1/m.26097